MARSPPSPRSPPTTAQGGRRRRSNGIDNAARDFGNQVEWRHVGPGELLDLLQKQAPVNDRLQLVGLATVEEFQFRRVLIGRCPVGELARLADQYGNRLFERNIRRYLGLAGNRVNEALAATLREPEQRPNFYFYNNGVTLTCSQFRTTRSSTEAGRCRWTICKSSTVGKPFGRCRR